MRQKVGKERCQEGCAPLAIPRRFLACPLRKFGPSPTPLRLCKTPVGVPSGTAEAGDSKRVATCSANVLRPKLGPFYLALPSRRGGRPPPPPYGPDCCSKTAIADRAPLRRPPRRAQLRCCSAGYGAFSEKEPRPTVSGRAPGKFFRFNSSLKRYISLLRRGARWFERTGLKPAGLRFRRGGAPKGRLIGLTGEKTVFGRAPWEILPFQLIVETVYFPFKAWRAVPLGTRKLGFARQLATTALRGRRPGDPGGTGKTSFCWGLTGEKTVSIRACG